jgi:acyl-coenzyme A synthetase/AMP-(fatty) acid ligase
MLAFAPLTFDASFHELFATFCAGGVAVLAPACVRRDVQLLGELIAAERIERAILPVVVLQQLAERWAGDDVALATLREVFATGEALRITPETARLFAGGRRVLHNHYGPTETHVVTAYRLPDAAGAWPLSPPIGRPIANTTLHVVDRHGAHAPIGVAGELLVGGDMLARGYLAAPDATAERFVPSPFARGERLYRTGDLARWLPDGNLQFLRRIDQQVKVRGHRVEPGEIEAALAAHEQVQTAVVIARDDVAGGRLVGYVVPSPGAAATLTARALKAHLGARLPEPMIPSEIVLLDALPLTPNGKLDRGALPAPAPAADDPFVAPRNDTERRIAEIWATVLRLPRVGVKDDFFAVGGHSLLATQISLRISRAFGVKLLARVVFERPSVERLAETVDALVAEAAGARK